MVISTCWQRDDEAVLPVWPGLCCLTTRLVTAGTVELEARVRLSHVNKAKSDEDTYNDADGKHPKHELCSPAPIHAVASHDLSIAER